MTYMRSWKSHRLTSHTWLGLNPQIGRPLSRIVGAIGLFFIWYIPAAWNFSCSSFLSVQFSTQALSSTVEAYNASIEAPGTIE
jgi:hypothetical protein